MRRVKQRLPKWLISKLPYKGEDEAISAIVVPVTLFSFMGIGLTFHEFYNSKWIVIEILITVILILAVLTLARWTLAQVELLKACREELMLRYKIVENPEEKEEIKEKLRKLCVFVKWKPKLREYKTLGFFD